MELGAEYEASFLFVIVFYRGVQEDDARSTHFPRILPFAAQPVGSSYAACNDLEACDDPILQSILRLCQ